MGCSSLSRPNYNKKGMNKACTYPRKCTVKIKSSESKSIPSENQPFDFVLTDPIHLRYDTIIINNLCVTSTQCVLPGIDPRGEYFKKCQDNCFYLSDDNGTLCCLFDGHGAQGERVAEFCQIIIQKLFEKRKKILNVKKR